MDTNERLRRLLEERGWTEYRLAKKCGLSQSTIANIYRRNTVPSIATLEVICNGFGITLSQFFADEEMVELTPDLKAVFESWVILTPDQKAAALQMLRAMDKSE
jgi:transcriptional regulator with XRE-family HTH domain